jgi:hypothetical protein
MMRRWLVAVLSLPFLPLLALGGRLDAQGARTGTGIGAARAGESTASQEAVRLLVRPRVGDTLWLQVDQVIEMSGQRTATPERPAQRGMANGQGAPPPSRDPEIGPRRARTATRVTSMQLFAHSTVEASDLSITTLQATTDSITMWVGTAAERPAPQAMPLPPDGRSVRVRVSPNGTMTVSDPPPGATALGTSLAAMPGMLPDRPVAVGQRWERDLPLPSLPITGYHAEGVVRASFRLDSLVHGGRDAYISLAGTLRRDKAARDLPAGTRVVTAGTITGYLVVDRVRGWITDARTTMDVQSEVSQGTGVGTVTATPVLLDIRLTQRVHVR